MSSHGGGISSNANSPKYYSSSGGGAAVAAVAEPAVEPRRLELSINQEDGSLQTASLFKVLLAATDALYTDLYNMVQGEIDVITTSAVSASQENDDNANNDNNNEEQPEGAATVTTSKKKERLSNLSFAQRRHELAWRLASNGKRIQQVAALTAAVACTDLSNSVQVSTKALQHARTAWVQADEAQDALYFFHAQLFPSRASPHDIYGALDIILTGKWYDLPRDLLLNVDRYETSKECTWTKQETDHRWQLSVRDKLITGEVGYNRRKRLLLLRQNDNNIEQSSDDTIQHHEPLWKVSLKGGIVKFTYGKPKMLANTGNSQDDTNDITSDNNNALSTATEHYPIEALLTVIPSPNNNFTQSSSSNSKTTIISSVNRWTLLSVAVNVQAKTGEFNHQLETSNRQRYDLHRLAALAMSREENKWLREQHEQQQQKEEQEENDNHDDTQQQSNDNNDNHSNDQEEIDTGNQNGNKLTSKTTTTKSTSEMTTPSQPLQALFQVTHTFLLSWQLELLSAQAQALRRGVWAATTDSNNSLTVTPVRFHDDTGIGIMAISFWKVDDSYGPPAIGDLVFDDEETTAVQSDYTAKSIGTLTSQFTLAIRAKPNVGVQVSLSGAGSIMNVSDSTRQEQIRSTTHDLLEAASNPFALSASDALLAATKICAELKCQAVVHALQPSIANNNYDGKSSNNILPPWIHLSLIGGSITVAARIQYHGIPVTDSDYMPILFQIMCDARTGSFVSTFPRSMELLRRLACNDTQCSEPMSLRIASLPPNRRRAAGANSSGRIVREAFDSLIRSMNLLGQRAGVGGKWDDIDDKSAMLRNRSIAVACADVKTSIIKCCGLTALYGLAPLAIGTAVGLDAIPDMAGPALKTADGLNLLPTPPLSILMEQELIESSVLSSDGVNKKLSYINQTLFSLSCSVSENGVCLYPFDITVKIDSPTSFPERLSSTLLEFNTIEEKTTAETNGHTGIANGDTNDRPCKRPRNGMNGSTHQGRVVDVMEEVEHLSILMSSILEADQDE